MVKQKQITEFLAQRTVALVGLSRSGQALSNRAYDELVARGYRVYPINPNAEEIRGRRCYHHVADLLEPAGSALFFTPPAETETAVREAVAAGIKHLWLQPGAEPPAAIHAGQEYPVNLVTGECIFMFLTPEQFPHNFHRWVSGALGKLPR